VLFAAFIGSYLALRKFKKEKIWQEKYSAYQEILGAIQNMKHWADETYSSCLCLPTIGGSEGKEFHRGYAEARKCISKYIDIGKLLISDEVANKLDEMNQLLWEEDFRFGDEGMDDSNYHHELSEHAGNILRIINDRLEDIIKFSRKDLR
jgi:hypothetical protein